MPNFAELLERALAWLEPFYQTWGYLVVIGGALLEHTFFLAWAMPGGILVALGGLYAQDGDLSLPLVILGGMLGFALGDHIDYFVGRRGSGVLDRLLKGRQVSASYVWSLRAIPALVLGYTNTIPRAAFFMGGAAAGLAYPRFLAISLSLAAFWSSVFSILGYWLGSNRRRLFGVLEWVGGGPLAVLILAAVVYYVLNRRKRRPANTATT